MNSRKKKKETQSISQEHGEEQMQTKTHKKTISCFLSRPVYYKDVNFYFYPGHKTYNDGQNVEFVSHFTHPTTIPPVL